MERPDFFVMCPKRGEECSIDTCPRYLTNVAIKINSDGSRTASGFCNERGSRYISNVPERFIHTREVAATLEFTERDAREEVGRLEAIRKLVEDQFFYVVREAQDGEPAGSDGVLFDTIVEAIVYAQKELAVGKISAPRVANQWQLVLPEVLTFPDYEDTYFITKDLESHPEAFESTLPDGTKENIGIFSQPNLFAPKVARIRELVKSYLQLAINLARLNSSVSATKWIKALGLYNQVVDAWTMPESRPLMNEMAALMVEAASELHIDLAMPAPSTAQNVADAVSKGLGPKLDDISRLQSKTLSIAERIEIGFQTVFKNLKKWLVPKPNLKPKDVADVLDRASRYKCLARVEEPRKSQIMAVIDYTYDHPIVHEKDPKYGKDQLSLSEAARIVFDRNTAKWSVLSGGYPNYEAFKVACYSYRGKDNDPYRYVT